LSQILCWTIFLTILLNLLPKSFVKLFCPPFSPNLLPNFFCHLFCPTNRLPIINTAFRDQYYKLFTAVIMPLAAYFSRILTELRR
jgi:hypothetical protein